MNHPVKTDLPDGYLMVVEDSKLQATMLKALLREHHFKVRVFSNGAEAYEAAAESPPVLIVSDVIMPEMDGYELCEKIKNTTHLRDIPVILLTSLQDPMDIIKGLQSGADNFITKPFESKYLLSRINYLLANRELRSVGASDMVINIMFNGNKYAINSERKQILDLLLSVYETAIHQNRELLETQAQLQRTNEHLIMANRDLESFSYTISHDLRTPLNHISVSTQLLQEDYAPKLDEQGQSYLETIISTTRAMTEMINDLLQFSRSGSISIQKKRVDLSDMAKKVMEWIYKDDPTRPITVEIQDGLSVTGDHSLLMVVLKNLLGNAWKYTGKTAHPVISFGSVKVDGEAIFFVKDNGAGFDMHQAGNLFTPFYRLHSQEEFPGTGVGLATVRRIIERHGGRIWAEGKAGQGATFFFTIKD